MNAPADVNKVAILINKLLALAKDGGATEAEASLAAEKAQDLMTQHNLSMANIEAAGGQSGDDGQRVKDGISHRQVYKWQRTLMKALAELNFCYCQEKFEYRRSQSVFDGYTLIGRAANVASTRVMFDYLLQTIDRVAKDEVQDPAQYFTRYAHSFKEGCADRVIERLQARRADEVKTAERKAREDKVRNSHPGAATGNALVVVLGDYVQDEEDLNNDMRRGVPPGTTKARRAEYEREQAALRIENQRKYDERKALILSQQPGIDPQKLDWLAQGFSEESVDKWLKDANKVETDAQRRKRIEREKREYDRWRDQQHRQDAKKDWRGYSKGREAGDGVGLDRQVGRGTAKGIT